MFEKAQLGLVWSESDVCSEVWWSAHVLIFKGVDSTWFDKNKLSQIQSYLEECWAMTAITLQPSTPLQEMSSMISNEF